MASNKSRTKGHAYERSVAKFFKELGWDCVTSRSESKRTDDMGIDLCYTDPFCVQAKAVERLGSHHAILKGMPDRKGKYNLVFHKKNHSGTVVSMELETFRELLEMLIANKILTPGEK